MDIPDHARDPTTSGSHYFSESPTVASERAHVRLDLPDLSVDLVTDRGVFSPGRIDPGTKLLLSELGDLPEGDVIDLGCGYGPIAVTLALRWPDRRIWAVDTNSRARRLCHENLLSNIPAADRIQVMAPEDVPGYQRFAAIVSNPPIRVGKAALHDLMTRWLTRLEHGGEGWFVVHRHLGADSLAKWLNGQGYEVERVRSRQGYRVLRVTHGGHQPGQPPSP